MGLTIHYNLATDLNKPKDIRKLVERISQHALDLPFKEVGEIKEFKGNEIGFDDKDDPDRWLKIQASGHVNLGESYFTVPPRHIIAFSTWPGDGSEEANFGFCKYPGFIAKPDSKRRLATKLTGWRWSSFCKTQYASDPQSGGIENFLRCHLSVIKLLDCIKANGLVTVEVSDEGEFWENRDLENLAKGVGQWNEHLAGVFSLIRSSLGESGMALEAPITNFQNFEHLEAKGLDKLREQGGKEE